MIKKAKPYWAAFNASSYIKELTVGNIWLVHGYSNDIFQANLDAQAAGRKFKILQGMPKEGAVLAVDNMVIDKDAPRPDLALKFMNFMLEGQNSAELTNLIGSGNPNADAVKFIKPELLKNPAIFPDKAVAGEARAAAGPHRRATAAAQQAVDRDQGRPLNRPSSTRFAWRACRRGARIVTVSRRGSLLPHFLATLYGLAIVYASLQPFVNWMAPVPGAPYFPVRSVAATVGALRPRHQHRRLPSVRILRRADAALARACRGSSRSGSGPAHFCRSRWNRCRCSCRPGTRMSPTSSPIRQGRRSAAPAGGGYRPLAEGGACGSRPHANAGFLPGAAGDIGLALLAIWLAVQANPAIPLFAAMYDSAARPSGRISAGRLGSHDRRERAKRVPAAGRWTCSSRC